MAYGGPCAGCGTAGDAEDPARRHVGLIVEPPARPASLIPLCGSCLAEGLAILLGRKHVERLVDAGTMTPSEAAFTLAAPAGGSGAENGSPGVRGAGGGSPPRALCVRDGHDWHLFETPAGGWVKRCSRCPAMRLVAPGAAGA